MSLPWLLVLLPAGVFLYAYVAYPIVIWGLAKLRRLPLDERNPVEWPELTILLPVHNESQTIREALESLLSLHYPPERRHIVVVSDASNDGTDRIVREFADRGVTLVELPRRVGKTGAENAAADWLRGTIVVSTDATTRILPGSLQSLVQVLADPRVGLASGNNVSVTAGEPVATPRARKAAGGELWYTTFEMQLRALESRVDSIVGASGCFFAIRRELFQANFPEELSRDFASALITVESGLRAVLVPEAVCLVPRAPSLRVEFRRKIRTMTRGLQTLWVKRNLLDPRARPLFAFMLFSHKLARWIAIPLVPIGIVGLMLLARNAWWAGALLLLIGAGLTAGGLALRWPQQRAMPRPLSLFGYAFGALVAGWIAWANALRGRVQPIWEPTRRF